MTDLVFDSIQTAAFVGINYVACVDAVIVFASFCASINDLPQICGFIAFAQVFVSADECIVNFTVASFVFENAGCIVAGTAEGIGIVTLKQTFVDATASCGVCVFGDILRAGS